MTFHELMKKALPQIPSEIAIALQKNEITGTPFSRKNDILLLSDLQNEVGYKKMADGSYLVSMTCPMPVVTPDMINWWFWWHPQASERYRMWYPGEHIGISYAQKDRAYFEQDQPPTFKSNTHYPTEKIDGVKTPLRIDFVTPEEFGFSRELMAANKVPLIVCGHVGVFKGLVWHTEMAHIFKETEDGLRLISRFWIGQTLKSPILRELILTDKTANGMAEHCCIEYRNLAEILPYLYPKKKP